MDLRGIWEAFFDNPSDEEYEYFPPEREHHNKIPHYFENIVSAYTLTGKTLKKEIERDSFAVLLKFNYACDFVWYNSKIALILFEQILNHIFG